MYLSDAYTISLNLSGLPGISLPIGKSSEGLPIGAQLIGKAYNEIDIFDGALSLERELKGGERWELGLGLWLLKMYY